MKKPPAAASVDRIRVDSELPRPPPTWGKYFYRFIKIFFQLSNVTGMQYELVCVPEPASVSVAAVSSLLRELEEAEPEGPFRTTTGK